MASLKLSLPGSSTIFSSFQFMDLFFQALEVWISFFLIVWSIATLSLCGLLSAYPFIHDETGKWPFLAMDQECPLLYQ